MSVIEEILEAMQLAPVAVGLFQQLLALFGNKDTAKAVTMAAIAHPALAPNVALRPIRRQRTREERLHDVDGDGQSGNERGGRDPKHGAQGRRYHRPILHRTDPHRRGPGAGAGGWAKAVK
jgi:hypothetical protein